MVKIEYLAVLVLGLSFFACDCVESECNTNSHDGACMTGICVLSPNENQEYCVSDDLDLGDSCWDDRQCRGDGRDDIGCYALDEFEPNGPHECMQLKAQGDKCGYGERCMYGLACIDSVCVPKQPEGARCYVSRHREDCSGELICMPDNPNLLPLPEGEVYKQGVCALRRREGQTCQPTQCIHCEDGLKCEDGRCIQPPPPEPPEPIRLSRGFPCSSHKGCKRGLVCYQGQCAQVYGCVHVEQKPKQLEQTGCLFRDRDVGLYTDLECQTDEQCNGGYCVLGVCHQYPACSTDDECADGTSCWENVICLGD